MHREIEGRGIARVLGAGPPVARAYARRRRRASSASPAASSSTTTRSTRWLNPQRYAVTGPERRAAVSPTTRERASRRSATRRARPLIRAARPRGGPVVVFVRAGRRPASSASTSIRRPASVLDAAPAARLHRLDARLPRVAHAARVLAAARSSACVGIAMLISSLERHLPVVAAPGGSTARDVRLPARASRCRATCTTRSASTGALVLAMLSFTGIFLGFPRRRTRGRRRVRHGLAVAARPCRARRAEGAADPRRRSRRRSRARYPGVAGDVGRASRWGRAASIASACATDARRRCARRTVVFVDPRSRDVLLRVDRTTRGGGDTFLMWQRMLHEGSAGGEAGRFVTFLAD